MCTCNNDNWSTNVCSCGSCSSDECCNNSGNDSTEALVISPAILVMKSGETAKINVRTNLYQYVTEEATWRSSDYSVVDVDLEGNITARYDGTATITATYNGMTASCVVTVDSRPLVRVEKDGDHFLVHFVEPAEGEALLWESVGCDLDLKENRTGYHIWEDDEDLLNSAERHHKHNCDKHYTYDQLALLYRLDPFGVIKYVENYALNYCGSDINDQLIYKDNVYKAIFEVKSGKFFFRPNDDGIPVYGSYSNWKRKDVYSLAELVFGKHTIIEFDWVDFITNSIKAIFSPLEIFSTIFSTIELCQVLFFNGALQGSVSSEISTYLSHELEVTDTDKFLYPEALVEKKMKAFRKFTIWSVVLGVVQAGIDALSLLDADIVNVCKSVKQHINYRVILQNGGLELEVDNICATLDN